MLTWLSLYEATQGKFSFPAPSTKGEMFKELKTNKKTKRLSRSSEHAVFPLTPRAATEQPGKRWAAQCKTGYTLSTKKPQIRDFVTNYH